MAWANGVEPVELGSSRAGWHLAALELWRLWEKRPKLRKRTLLFVAWRFVPPNVKLIAIGVASGLLLLFAAGFAALVFGITQLT